MGKKYTIDAVWKYVEKRGENDCWPWLGYTSSGRGGAKYGRIDMLGCKGVYAHRVAYLAANPGSLTLVRGDGLSVLHKCDNGICCNPSHLFLGTHEDNMKDKVAKGRQKRWPDSTKSPNAKLTAEDVFCIKHQKKNGATTKALQMLYEVSRATIQGAIRGRHYKDVA